MHDESAAVVMDLGRAAARLALEYRNVLRGDVQVEVVDGRIVSGQNQNAGAEVALSKAASASAIAIASCIALPGSDTALIAPSSAIRSEVTGRASRHISIAMGRGSIRASEAVSPASGTSPALT